MSVFNGSVQWLRRRFLFCRHVVEITLYENYRRTLVTGAGREVAERTDQVREAARRRSL